MNEVSEANLNADKRILKCQPFLHKVNRRLNHAVGAIEGNQGKTYFANDFKQGLAFFHLFILAATWHQYDDAIFSQPGFWDSLLMRTIVQDPAEGRRLAMLVMLPEWDKISLVEGRDHMKASAALTEINGVVYCMSNAEVENGGYHFLRIPCGFKFMEVCTVRRFCCGPSVAFFRRKVGKVFQICYCSCTQLFIICLNSSLNVFLESNKAVFLEVYLCHFGESIVSFRENSAKVLIIAGTEKNRMN